MIDQILRQMNGASTVDKDSAEEIISSAIERLNNKTASAVDFTTFSETSGVVDNSTIVWNSDVVREVSQVEGFVGESEIEIIAPRESELYFISVPEPKPSNIMDVDSQDSPDNVFYYGTRQQILDTFGADLCKNVYDHDFYRKVINNGRVTKNDGIAIFEYDVDSENCDWLDSDSFLEETNTTGLYFVITYDIDNNRFDQVIFCTQDEESPYEFSVGEFLHSGEFEFTIPSEDDDNVQDISESPKMQVAGNLTRQSDGLNGDDLSDMLGLDDLF